MKEKIEEPKFDNAEEASHKILPIINFAEKVLGKPLDKNDVDKICNILVRYLK